MKKFLTFALVFALGLGLGGAVRYSTVEAKLAEVEASSSVVSPASSPGLGHGGGGSCG